MSEEKALPPEAQQILDSKGSMPDSGKELGLIEQAIEERKKLEKARDEVRIEIEKLEKIKASAILAGRGQAGFEPTPKSPQEAADERAKALLKEYKGYD